MKSLEKRKKLAAEVNAELKRLFPEARCILRYSNPWELLVAVILSAQCTDKKVNEVTAKLFKKYSALEDYVKADAREFEKDIFSTGFYRNKTKNILAAAKMVQKTYGGAVPRTMKEMIAIPGVARKTANVVLGNVHKVYEGIAVDTHVRRISRATGLSKHSDPNKIEQDLMKVLPPEEWFPFTYRVIEYGRNFCTAKKHRHDICPLTDIVKRYA